MEPNTTPEAIPCPNHFIHPYHFEELKLGSGSNEQRYFRASIFFNKKPGLTDEFFHDHWKSVHADLTMQVKDTGVTLVRYQQFHQTPQAKIDIEPLLEAANGTMKIAPYDGCAEFHAESAEQFTAYMKNLYASPHLVGCGQRFADMVKGYDIMVGYENLIMGHAFQGAGANGILADDARLIKKEVDAKEEPVNEKSCGCTVDVKEVQIDV